jgi:hypothetical protein
VDKYALEGVLIRSQNYLFRHYIQALAGGVLVPDWLQRELVSMVSFVEEYRGTWKANDTLQSQEIPVIESLRWKVSVVTDALSQGQFLPEAWVATVDLLELFGRAHPEDRFPDGHLDTLRIIWFVLMRNAAVSFTPTSTIPWLIQSG